jgi:hypothetical protein
MSKADSDNRSNQLNPNNDAYYQSRGFDGRPSDDDDDDGDDDCGYRGHSYTYSPPPPPRDKYFLETHSARVRQDAADLRREHFCLDLCDFLMLNHPYFVYRDMGWRTAVIVHVIDCEVDSADAAIIKILANGWLANFKSRDKLTVFRIEFHSEGRCETVRFM